VRTQTASFTPLPAPAAGTGIQLSVDSFAVTLPKTPKPL